MTCLVQGREDRILPAGATPPPSASRSSLMLALFYLAALVDRAARAGPRAGTAWIGLGLALLTAPDMLNYVNYVMTEIDRADVGDRRDGRRRAGDHPVRVSGCAGASWPARWRGWRR